MNKMDIDLFSYIRDTDYALSARFSLSRIEYTESERYIKNNAIAVVRFYLHTPAKDSVKLEQRNIVFTFDRFGEVSSPYKILTDTAEYARIVDSYPEFQKAESDLSEAICAIIALAVKKHFSDEATEN